MEPKTSKNQLHLDLRPVDQEAEVARLVNLGATYADVGQGDETWVVLADPGGDEFCVLAPRQALPGDRGAALRVIPRSRMVSPVRRYG